MKRDRTTKPCRYCETRKPVAAFESSSERVCLACRELLRLQAAKKAAAPRVRPTFGSAYCRAFEATLPGGGLGLERRFK